MRLEILPVCHRAAGLTLNPFFLRVQMDRYLKNHSQENKDQQNLGLQEHNMQHQQKQKLQNQEIQEQNQENKVQQNQEFQAIRAEMMQLRSLVQQLVHNRTESG